ncbi:MAG: hypothetical protein R2823_08675 [Acidimicrobiia bacterium]
MEDDLLQRVLAEMGATDPDRGRDAEAVAEWLTAGEGVDVIDLASVQRFAWYGLPLKWFGSADRHRRVLAAAAELFGRLDLPQYAAVCQSQETAEILDAYAVSGQRGFKAFRKATERSGVDPPDLEGFAWGDVMGVEEAVAQVTAERALEEAISQGTLTPGARGWKSVAREITRAVLDSAHPTLPGQTHRTAIVTERLDAWLSRVERHSPALHRLRSRHVNQLLHPIPVPADIADRMEPITWFLDRVDEGALLTQAGYLPTAMVREGWERFSWDLGWTDRAPRSEVDVVQVHELHHLLRRLGAVRRRGPDLRLSRLGQRMRDDPHVAWRVTAAGLSDGEWPRAVAEAFTLLFLEGEEHDRELESQATAIVAEAGWQTGGEPPDASAVNSTWWETRRPLTVLGGIECGYDWRSPITTLTGFGEATLLEQIRVNATGPRSRP